MMRSARSSNSQQDKQDKTRTLDTNMLESRGAHSPATCPIGAFLAQVAAQSGVYRPASKSLSRGSWPPRRGHINQHHLVLLARLLVLPLWRAASTVCLLLSSLLHQHQLATSPSHLHRYAHRSVAQPTHDQRHLLSFSFDHLLLFGIISKMASFPRWLDKAKATGAKLISYDGTEGSLPAAQRRHKHKRGAEYDDIPPFLLPLSVRVRLDKDRRKALSRPAPYDKTCIPVSWSRLSHSVLRPPSPRSPTPFSEKYVNVNEHSSPC
ncbi:hypothetical protein C8Q74DRAFT_246652 [Fomes fomentarius]|nr:hypothetical protein C8Q74DRAFT_246652 [Fomes fomentarius]